MLPKRNNPIPAERCCLSNAEILAFVLGWSGGNVHQVADALKVNAVDVINADHSLMMQLCRRAQEHERSWMPPLRQHLGHCLYALKIDYCGHGYPLWLTKALEVYNRAMNL